MATSSSHQAIGTLQSRGYFSNSCFKQENIITSFRFVSKGVELDFSLFRRDIRCSRERSPSVIQVLASQSRISEPILSPSNGSASSNKKSTEAALVLIRHGESMWNEKNLFTGCVDVPLTKKGVEEANKAGKRITNIPVDVIYTSSLIHAQMIAMLAMTERRRKKVPIVLHDKNEQARSWSQIFSEDTKKQCIPFITAWQLNERMYGELQGLSKQETAERNGKEQVHEWRRSYDTPPPNGESLQMCAERAVAYFKDYIEPQLLSGKNVMIAVHGNSLSPLLCIWTSCLLKSLELSTGVPMLYIFKERRFIRRGSPVAPTEVGVYAYTKSLAQYREKLDEMLQS